MCKHGAKALSARALLAALVAATKLRGPRAEHKLLGRWDLGPGTQRQSHILKASGAPQRKPAGVGSCLSLLVQASTMVDTGFCECRACCVSQLPGEPVYSDRTDMLFRCSSCCTLGRAASNNYNTT